MEKMIALVAGMVAGVKAAFVKVAAFVTSKIGKLAVFAAFTILVAGWSYHNGKVQSDTEVASLLQQLQSAKDEARTNKLAADSEHLKAEKAIADKKTANGISAELKKRVDNYVSSLGKRKGGACTITDADTRGLLSIR